MTGTLERPTWDAFFFGLAFAYARRSRDPRTRHGCVIVDPRNNHIVGTGYNSFLAGLPDGEMPTTAPEKYPHMDHAEVNATASLRLDPFSVPGGLTAYITGHPCLACARDLVRHNVLNWSVADRPGHTDASRDRRDDTDLVVRSRGVRVEVHRADVSWLADPDWHAELRSAGMMGQGVGATPDDSDRWLIGCLDEHFPNGVVVTAIGPDDRHVQTAIGVFEVDVDGKVAIAPDPVDGHVSFDISDRRGWDSLRRYLSFTLRGEPPF